MTTHGTDEGEWKPWQIAKLLEMWPDQANSLGKIARAINRSKASVNGKAQRLGVPPRPSPIKPRGTRSRPVQPRRAPAQTLPPPAAEIPVVVMPTERFSISGQVGPLSMRRNSEAVRGSTLSTTPAAVLYDPHRPIARPKACTWPIGEPGTPTFRTCDAATVPKKSYCEAHCSRAYVRTRPRDGPAPVHAAE